MLAVIILSSKAKVNHLDKNGMSQHGLLDQLEFHFILVTEPQES